VREVLAALMKDLGRWVIWDLVLVFNNVACWPTSLSQLSLLEAVREVLAALLKDLGRWVDACVWFG
jgi:hypothetical protein